ncbi:MAG: hypothetical protein ACRENG_00425, partial [bacterium]
MTRNFSLGTFLLLASWLPAILIPHSVTAQTCTSEPILTGYRDFNFGTEVFHQPTAEKPESKIWWNDGLWWGSLW